MQDWKQILLGIYCPAVGSLWTATNGIWDNSFAANKDKNDCHPTVVGKINKDSNSCKIIPGTTKDYQKGTCVYKVKLKNENDCPYSHFLLKFWMTYNNRDLLKLKRGWNMVEIMNDDQIKGLKLQIKFCHGIDV